MSKLQTDGFTLIELMVVVAIAAILASIALPSYQESVRKARRAEARSALMQLMQQQERYYTLHTKYVAFSRTSSNSDAQQFKWYSGSTAGDSAYEISGEACNGDTLSNCIKLVATSGTANVKATSKDEGCLTLTLTSTGVKGATGKATNCW